MDNDNFCLTIVSNQPPDYFVTCDDKLLKKVCKLKGINMEAVNPVNFCTKENLR